MNLLKKLLPIASVAGVATIVAPLITSCGAKTYEYDAIECTTGKYKWVDKKGGELALSEATKTYLKDVEKNKKIFADDAVYSSFLPNSEGKATVKIKKVDVKNSRMSYELKAWQDVVITPGQPATHVVNEYNIENLPVEVDCRVIPEYSSDKIWYVMNPWVEAVQYAPLFMQLDKDWKVSIKISMGDNTIDRTWNCQSSFVDLEYAMTFLAVMFIPSYYLSETVCLEE